MHIIIGFLTAVATLLYVLERLGIDIGWLNPWAWKRRRAWLKQSTGNPIFALNEPIDAIALLATAAAKIDGDIALEEKEQLKAVFQKTFNQSEKEASQLLGASVHLLGSGEEVYQSPEKIVKCSLPKFTEEQKSSSINLISEIINLGTSPSDLQTDFLEKIKRCLSPATDKSNW